MTMHLNAHPPSSLQLAWQPYPTLQQHVCYHVCTNDITSIYCALLLVSGYQFGEPHSLLIRAHFLGPSIIAHAARC